MVTPRPQPLLLLDFNQFKDINDTLGHGAGDEVLRQMKDRFDQALAGEDAIAARLGGDELALHAVSAPPRPPCGLPRSLPTHWRSHS